jgi:hypothetical protein
MLGLRPVRISGKEEHMAVDAQSTLARGRNETNKFPYQDYMDWEGIPVYEEVVGIPDVTALPRKPWARTGGNGTFIQLVGTFESERGLYVADIPGGKALEPEKHLYEEEIFVLEGQGVSEV